MYQFGFELEGFYWLGNTITLPPANYTTDGFPGLCEVRTRGGSSIEDAYYSILKEFARQPFDFSTCEHTFTQEDKRRIRSRHNEKTAVDINNIYGKEPKALGNRTIASFQVNISYMVKNSYIDDKGNHRPAQYGLFDYYPIIKALDKEFEKEIMTSHRQKGFYAIKDKCRVEYRSLPNTVFEDDIHRATSLIRRIQNCVYKTE